MMYFLFLFNKFCNYSFGITERWLTLVFLSLRWQAQVSHHVIPFHPWQRQ